MEIAECGGGITSTGMCGGGITSRGNGLYICAHTYARATIGAAIPARESTQSAAIRAAQSEAQQAQSGPQSRRNLRQRASDLPHRFALDLRRDCRPDCRSRLRRFRPPICRLICAVDCRFAGRMPTGLRRSLRPAARLDVRGGLPIAVPGVVRRFPPARPIADLRRKMRFARVFDANSGATGCRPLLAAALVRKHPPEGGALAVTQKLLLAADMS
eukprot:gene20649-biopygen17594